MRNLRHRVDQQEDAFFEKNCISFWLFGRSRSGSLFFTAIPVGPLLPGSGPESSGPLDL
jgi:hypothetical protein